MNLYSRDEFLELPVGTVFQRFYPELMTADSGSDHIRPHPFIDLCIKGKTDGLNFEFSSITECVISDDHPDHAERDHMALCYGATDCHFPLDFETITLDVPSGHTNATITDGRETPPRLLYAVWSFEELDALAGRLGRARKHLLNARGLEM